MRYILMGLILCLKASLCFAAPLTPQNLYINPVNEKRSEAIILYNPSNPCEHCSQAIDMLIALLRDKYKDTLHAYLINTAKQPEFAVFFKAHAPLTLVIVRIKNSHPEGYEKLEGLQTQTYAVPDFNRRVTEFINNFLNID